jgi:hypothetical protein
VSDHWAGFFIIKLAGACRREGDLDSAVAFLNRGHAHALQKNNVKAQVTIKRLYLHRISMQVLFLLNLSLVFLQKADISKALEMLDFPLEEQEVDCITCNSKCVVDA